MGESADRYRKVAEGFSERVDAVPADAWDRPAPCEGWVARDVVRHLVGWMPGFFFDQWGLARPAIPSVDDDPAAAWHAFDAAFQAAIDDPAVADAERDTPMGPKTFAAAADMIGTTDVLIHTWDLARATGLDEHLDPDEVHRFVIGMEPMDEVIRGEHFGPRVAVPDDADEQTRLIAFVGRRP